MSEIANPSQRGRIDAIDLARFAALVAMAVYHFTWDLEFFGYVARGTTGQGGWRLFARAIASSFLFLAGVSLVLAHGREIRWRPFWTRWLQVAGGAAAITVATYFATPGSFVFFGILHEIAVASLVALLFLRLPWFLTALAAAAVLALPHFVALPALNTRWLAWIGLFERPPISNDFVPVFPWLGAVLLGVAAGRLATDHRLWDRLRGLNPRLARAAPLTWLGRHTLLFYLLHQPMLMALVWLATQVAPPDLSARFQDDCRRQCLASQSEALCANYCGCAERELDARGIMDSVMAGAGEQSARDALEEVVRLCSFEALDPQ